MSGEIPAHAARTFLQRKTILSGVTVKSAPRESFSAPVRCIGWRSAPLRVLALVLLLTAAPLWEAFRIASFSNGDIWWHLRTGLWILQNHRVPRSGLFSQYATMPWVASSWAFEALVASTYKWLGLKAFPALLMGFELVFAGMLFLLAGGWRRKFWIAILLSAAVLYVEVDLQPLPILFSILFFGIELMLLLESRRRGDGNLLYWLPPLFFLWANFHMQFVNGLLLLGLYVLAETVERWLHSSGHGSYSPRGYSLAKILAIACFSAIATLLTPYGFHLFNAFSTVYSKVLFKYFAEMYAFSFRRPQDFVALLLVMAAFLALGRQRSRDLFKIGVMVVFAMLAFRVQRDVWCVLLPSIAVISDAVVDAGRENARSGRFERCNLEKMLAMALALFVLVLAVKVRVPSNEVLMKRAARVLPITACDYIRTNHLPGPLFNAFNWGGFLIWYLPEYPVAIDSRQNLYNDELDRNLKVTEGNERLEDDPGFLHAQTILLERNSGMAKALTTLPVLRAQFHMVYEDDIAVILTRQ